MGIIDSSDKPKVEVRSIKAGREVILSSNIMTVKKDFTVQIEARGDNDFVCHGPHGLLLEAAGKTADESVECYLQIAGDQIVANVGSDRREERLAGLAAKVHADLIRDLLVLHP